MKKIYPSKLKKGDEIRVIAPSCSLGIISKENREVANKRFSELGFKLSFGKNAEEMDNFRSSSIESRVEDLQESFLDKNVKAVFAVIGGFNVNQLLKYIDWDIIKKNPKIFCGYSDTTALSNAIYAKTGLVNYNGPAYSSFAEKLNFDYTLDYFKRCLMSEDTFEILPSVNWSNDAWYQDQDNRNIIKNEGWWVISKGKARGTIFGGNLGTFGLLRGTEYFPEFKEDVVLFLEDEGSTEDQFDVTFDRDLQSLIQQSGFKNVKGIVIGRCEKVSQMNKERFKEIILSKKEFKNIPVIANVDFGHTTPMITFPIGGSVEIEAGNKPFIKILKH